MTARLKEFLVISSKHSHQVPGVSSISIRDATVQAVSSAKNIGPVLDDKLTKVAHVSSVCKSSYAYLHGIAQISWYLTQEVTTTLTNDLLMS